MKKSDKTTSPSFATPEKGFGPAFKIHALSQLMDKGAEQVLQEKMGISYSHFLILLILKNYGPSSQKEVANMLAVTPAAISRQIDALIEANLLRRQSRNGSRREYELSLTAKGEEKVVTSRQILVKRFDVLLQDVNLYEIEVFNRVLDHLLAGLNHNLKP
jgi:DNA-binding MarR family transcriptional regulator